MLSVQFGTGQLNGPMGMDDFHIGPFPVFNQTFGMIQTQRGSVFADVPFEGIVGLAFPAMSANKVTPFFDNVIQQKALEKNEFAFYFSRSNPSANAIFWGGVDPDFYEGNIEYFPVRDPYYWSTELHAFKIGDACLVGNGCREEAAAGDATVAGAVEPVVVVRESDAVSPQGLLQDGLKSALKATAAAAASNRPNFFAIVDTGTTYFTAEGDLFHDIMDRLPEVKCSAVTEQTHPPITYTLRNVAGRLRDYQLNNNQYMTQASEDEDAICSPAFMKINLPEAHGPGMVLGEIFIRHYFAVFDRGDGSDKSGRLGFAKSKDTDNAIGKLRERTHSQPSFAESRGDSE
jgi:pepsin A